ncbi:MAG: TonB-dependent receptor plug domain-containing protein, partial [Gammaproteobacteria bacterium]
MIEKQQRLNPLASAMRGLLLTTTGLLALNLNAAEAQEGDEADEESTIIITGSRIRRDGFDNDEPIEIISADDARFQGMESVGELLRAATIASGSPQVTSAISSEDVTAGGVGANTISLRGLGAARTLVLVNGRRAGAAGTRGEVSSFDLNVIPLSAI